MALFTQARPGNAQSLTHLRRTSSLNSVPQGLDELAVFMSLGKTADVVMRS